MADKNLKNSVHTEEKIDSATVMAESINIWFESQTGKSVKDSLKSD